MPVAIFILSIVMIAIRARGIFSAYRLVRINLFRVSKSTAVTTARAASRPDPGGMAADRVIALGHFLPTHDALCVVIVMSRVRRGIADRNHEYWRVPYHTKY